ncbi:MAG TPA: hypothetical protein VJ021_00450 [Thermoplasmata archaeon]|nr:hypothetical protein [Thermoplasmata archaeon]
MVGAAIVLVGAILLIAALFTPWYTVQVSSSGVSETQNAYPGLPSTNGTIQYTCSGLPSGISCPSQTSYNTARENNTGTIAETGFFLIIVGFILGLVGALLGFTSRNKAGRARPAMTLALVAAIVAIATVGMFAVALPTAIGQDNPGHTGTGPWSSFYGSSSPLTWGPGIGWYLAIGAFVVLLVGMIILALARKEPPEPVAAAPGPAATTVPPTS